MELTHITIEPKPTELGDGFDDHQDEAYRQMKIARAAPDLLTALEDLVNNGIGTKAIEHARAAIAKARDNQV